MAEEWELKSLERRIDSLQKQVDDAELRSREERRQRSDRLNWWFATIAWTLYVIAMTTCVVLGATGQLHHH
jgi:hypothetical protein